MRKTLLFLMFSLVLSAQNTQSIDLNQSIKDKKGLTKSVTFIDHRPDQEIGNIISKKESVAIKFATSDLKSEVEKWFTEDNKNSKGNNDIVILLEQLKIFETQPSGNPALKTKISSFLKRNDKYYFVNRFENVDAFTLKSTPSAVSYKIALNLATLIRNSYTKLPIGSAIPEGEIFNYDSVLMKSLKLFNTNPLTEGVYENYKSFRELNPKIEYHTVKNKKNEIVRIANNQDLRVADMDLFGFVDDGIPYKITPIGYLEIFKDEKGLYIISNRGELMPQNSSGATVGIMMGGGIAGVAIGMIIDSQTRKNRNDLGFYNVYIDSFTGDYVYEK